MAKKSLAKFIKTMGDDDDLHEDLVDFRKLVISREAEFKGEAKLDATDFQGAQRIDLSALRRKGKDARKYQSVAISDTESRC